MVTRRVLGWAVLFVLIAVNLGAVRQHGQGRRRARRPLYRRLGGREGIALVVGDFTTNMVADTRVNERFKGMKPARGREVQVQPGRTRSARRPAGPAPTWART